MRAGEGRCPEGKGLRREVRVEVSKRGRGFEAERRVDGRLGAGSTEAKYSIASLLGTEMKRRDLSYNEQETTFPGAVGRASAEEAASEARRV